jgi:ATP-dependent RNA helicase RhlE
MTHKLIGCREPRSGHLFVEKTSYDNFRKPRSGDLYNSLSGHRCLIMRIPDQLFKKYSKQFEESDYLRTAFKSGKLTFEELNLNKPLVKALADLEYIYPTPVQIKAFPVVMSGRDVVGIAQTGTGKTFAYLLPLLTQLTYSDQKDPRILILAPTRELVIQIEEEVKKLTKYSNLRSLPIYGGTNINTQKQAVYDGTDILVATPGRLFDLVTSGVLRMKYIQKLVIDEVDEMLDLGFRPQLTSIMDMLPVRRQNLMFSATLTKEVAAFIADLFYNPHTIEIAAHGTPIEKIIQQAYHVPNFFTKVNLLEMLIASQEEFSKVLVFVSTKKLADRLYEQMINLFPDQVGVIHSNKSQNNRINALKEFQEGTHRVLIATDIISRGLDITDVTHVINFDTPEVPGDYIHRIGRTGRADKDGVAITFINEVEQTFQEEIEVLMKQLIPIMPLPEDLIISEIFSEEEKPATGRTKEYIKTSAPKKPSGAFHEKKDKNKKVNLGGPRKRNPKFGKPASAHKTTKPAKHRF